VPISHEPGAQLRSRFAAQAGNLDRTLNAEWNTVQCPELLTASYSCLRCTGLAQRVFSVHVHKCIELWIQFLNLGEMRLQQLDRHRQPRLPRLRLPPCYRSRVKQSAV